MNATLFKALVALLPACLLFSELDHHVLSGKDPSSIHATHRSGVHSAQSSLRMCVSGPAPVSAHALGA